MVIEFARQSPAASQKAAKRVRPHALEKLVRDDGTIDWSPWYLTEEEDMGQSGEQTRIIGILQSSLQVLAEERGWSSVLVATDNFFAWVEGEPLVQVSPDIYLLDYPALRDPASGSGDVPGESVAASRSFAARMIDEPLPRRWEPWRPDHAPPRLAIEIVSQDWKKDYEINPARYDHLGVRELVLADPEAFVRDLSRVGRTPLVVYRRNVRDRLELVHRGPGPAHCVEIDAYLGFQLNSAGAARVRISRDAAGTDLVCTAWEKAAAAEEEVAAEKKKVAAEKKKVAAEKKKVAAEKKKVAAEKKKVAAAEEKVAAQAAEIAALRARLRDRDPE